eukprot:TRINITY_DN40605_c0_g1_i1.p2 TRINITY_DN40605_c0_g1~~TRINITY_DN40605_c0_g1_i1.p2  ORF type:complete len:123 (+),score=30.15 TRINITY_DN40605_c0_g1_i1:108-476(+)
MRRCRYVAALVSSVASGGLCLRVGEHDTSAADVGQSPGLPQAAAELAAKAGSDPQKKLLITAIAMLAAEEEEHSQMERQQYAQQVQAQNKASEEANIVQMLNDGGSTGAARTVASVYAGMER